MSRGLEDADINPYLADLKITSTDRSYIGDDHVWRWYRGTGVGPYPCISALQALEHTCDRLIRVGVPIRTLVSTLLDDCENIAMVGLVVGILVRHLSDSEDLLDPYFSEPLIWRWEFRRIVDEDSPLAADSEEIKEPDRRKWSLREAAMFTALAADDSRAAALRVLGETLIENERRIIKQERDTLAIEDEVNGSGDTEEQLTMVKGWASSLDQSRYEVRRTPEGLYLQHTLPEDVVDTQHRNSSNLQRISEEIRLKVRYYINRGEESVGAAELKADIASARDLLAIPSPLSSQQPWDVPALVAAEVIEACVLRQVDISDGDLDFAVETLLRVLEGEMLPSPFEYEETYFEEGADRSAARVLPLLLTPAGARLREIAGSGDGEKIIERAFSAGLKAAQAVAYEVRLNLARGLDHLWETPCVQDGSCHHQAGLRFATETMRYCAVGGWNPYVGRHSVIALEEPLAESLGNIPDDSILPSRLDAAIRALAPAATANVCVSSSAYDLLSVLLAAQRRSLLTDEDNSLDDRGTHTLVSARALLTLAQQGDDTAIYEHIDAYADNPALLGSLLRALSAAAEEDSGRAATVRRLWPLIIHHVLDLNEAGKALFQGGSEREMALASLIPIVASQNVYLYREIEEEPIVWWEPSSLRPDIEVLLATEAGKIECVDRIIAFLGTLRPEDQARVGLPWMTKLVLDSPGQVAKRSFLLPAWLIETRSAAESASLSDHWQQLVDALVVEGVTQLAHYSE